VTPALRRTALDRLSPRLRSAAYVVAAALALFLLVPAVLPDKAPAGELLLGVEIGAVNGLLALGLVLTYRATRVVNFSYGAMGAVSGTLGILLYLSDHVNWFLCLVIGSVAGVVIGLVTDSVFRWFFNAPRLILMVATIGLSSGWGGIQFLMTGWFGKPVVGAFPTPLTNAHVQIHPVIFNGNDLLIAVLVPVVIVGLGWFLMRTDAGVAVRSMSDNADRAMLLGIPVKRLSTLVWVIAGPLAALTVMVNAPSQGLTVAAGIGTGPVILLPALAAFVIARMESLPVAFLSAVGLAKQSVEDVVFLVVILVALLVQRNRSSRADDVEGSWQAIGVLKPIPQALRRLPEVVAGRVGVLAVIGAVVVAVPFLVGPGTQLTFTFAVIYGIVAVSLVLLSGWSGNVSLGQFALAGAGGVLAGDLVAKYNVDLFFCIAAAAVGGALLAIVVGLPALRIRGPNLAVTTLALAVAANGFVFNPTNFENLIPGSIVRPVLWKRFDLGSYRANYFFCLAFLVLIVLFVKGLRRARAGRTLLAVRDNERAASAMGVPTVRAKLVGFVTAGAIAGIAGALYAGSLGAVGYDTFDPSLSILVFVMAVIGGMGSMSGALVGVAVIELLLHYFPQWGYVITGAGLVWMLQAMPGGMGDALFRLRDRLLRVVAARRHIEVPSLIADRRLPPTDHAPREDALLATALTGGADEAGVSAAVLAETEGRGAEAPTAEVPAVVAAGAARPGPSHNGDGHGPPPVLSCKDVEVSYGPVQVLFGVDLEVHEGEIVALLGTNGAGKSTLLKGISGLVKVSSGAVAHHGRPTTNAAPDAMAKSGIGLMPGGRGIFPTLTVEENLRLATWLLRKQKQRVSAARAQALELFPVLGQRMHQQAGNLSGGEQQMLSLAMAFMTRPKLLMIDELSLGLAPTIVSQLLDVVRMLHEMGTTIVVVEQSVNVALELSERAVFLEKGEVRFSGPTSQLLDRPDILRSVFIAGAGAVTEILSGGASRQPAVAANGADGDGSARRPPPPDAPVVLEVREVTKRFGGIRAVDGVSLELHQGEILGLIGHNGAGKTTLFDLVSGFLPLDGGRVILGQLDIGPWPAHLRALAGIGRTFQEAKLYPSLTVAETISIAFERHLESRDLVAAGLRLPASLDSEADVAEKVEALVHTMGLSAFREKLVGELSTGTRRIVELSCVLAQDPAVVLLDEPSGGVAQRETEALGPLLERVQQTTGCSILVIEHDMPLLTAICDRMIALELGEVIAEGTPAEILEHPQVIESYLGTDSTTIERSGARSL
jgi:ABC-type branched-subunit amino acid transport system ATPase component/ABC-type branched-subunit amino acid transport system permease subunit